MLTQGKVALVDDEDYERLIQYKWYAKKCGCKWYAYRSMESFMAMHTFIMNPPKQMQIDHIDGDGFNNQKSNLRICTPSENSCHKVCTKNKYKGVRKLSKKSWVGYINHNKKSIYLGSFNTEWQAAEAYNKKAKELYGDFAKLNSPEVDGQK